MVRSRALDERERFRGVVDGMRVRQPALRAAAWRAAPPEWRDEVVPMLTAPGWVLPRPRPLEEVELDWAEAADEAALVTCRERSSALLPPGEDGRPFTSYGRALVRVAGKGRLYNGRIYRPVGVHSLEGRLRLRFVLARYFDHLDTTEFLAYESSVRTANAADPFTGAYRRFLADPFDLSRRATGLGVVTLTIRRSEREAGFFLHRRNDDRVVVAPGMFQAVPAGEFSPADCDDRSAAAGLDLWHMMLREYAEELLGFEEGYGRGLPPPDYHRQWPYGELEAARSAGRVVPWVLGIGLDPLTWKAEILTACVLDAPVFDSVFARIAVNGQEGTVLTGPDGRGIPFEQESVHRYADHPGTRDSARGCLRLAWRHRSVLGLG
ncbi:hypothetical protein [Actinopolyspora mortivallis]|uniref:Uncharacterized protein n=1 Tax=Actinopolyspora mortivallis TaxID=33906 RepID=A0A2T0GYR2_ACTMO|nr:hypothetical protein [Actinopolyspora mortivallis]PRW64244.1 hypothetical protein CEP50_06315 [Actinopolyspora mortivallis]